MKEYSVEHKFTANSEFINRGSLSCSTSEYQCSISNNEDITDTLFDIPVGLILFIILSMQCLIVFFRGLNYLEEENCA